MRKYWIFSSSRLAGGGDQVAGAIGGIQTVSRDTRAQAQTVSAATEEQSAASQEIASSSRALAELANELQGAVARFRI